MRALLVALDWGCLGALPRLQTALRGEGWVVDVAADAGDGLQLARAHGFDLIVAAEAEAHAAPGFAAEARAAEVCAPILAMGEGFAPPAAVAALGAGADDWTALSVDLAEFRARAAALARRGRGLRDHVFEVGPVVVDLNRMDAGLRAGVGRVAWCDLTPYEYRLIEALALRAGRVVSKDSLYDVIYGADADGPGLNVIDVYVCKVRRKLGLGTAYLRTVWGRGYSLSAEADAEVLARAAMGEARPRSRPRGQLAATIVDIISDGGAGGLSHSAVAEALAARGLRATSGSISATIYRLTADGVLRNLNAGARPAIVALRHAPGRAA